MPKKARAAGTASKVRMVGSYRVTGTIAEGGCGKTYKGETADGLPVCIKDCSELPKEYSEVLFKEAKAMWDLRHFAIPAIREIVHLPDGKLALVMSYIPGRTLAEIVEDLGRLDPRDVGWITDRVLNALLYLHNSGVVHGDVKPHNIIVQEETHAVSLVDFGLAMCRPKAGDRSLGYTPLFAPPEQVEDWGALLPRSDLYSLGMTMIYALGGGEDAVEQLEIPRSVKKPMREFIQRLIVREPMERPCWPEEDLFLTFKKVRFDCFGEESSGMRKIAAAKDE